jgi:hypothetical protein
MQSRDALPGARSVRRSRRGLVRPAASTSRFGALDASAQRHLASDAPTVAARLEPCASRNNVTTRRGHDLPNRVGVTSCARLEQTWSCAGHRSDHWCIWCNVSGNPGGATSLGTRVVQRLWEPGAIAIGRPERLDARCDVSMARRSGPMPSCAARSHSPARAVSDGEACARWREMGDRRRPAQLPRTAVAVRDSLPITER